jgi:hypothetical protein
VGDLTPDETVLRFAAERDRCAIVAVKFLTNQLAWALEYTDITPTDWGAYLHGLALTVEALSHAPMSPPPADPPPAVA